MSSRGSGRHRLQATLDASGLHAMQPSECQLDPVHPPVQVIGAGQVPVIEHPAWARKPASVAELLVINPRLMNPDSTGVGGDLALGVVSVAPRRRPFPSTPRASASTNRLPRPAEPLRSFAETRLIG